MKNDEGRAGCWQGRGGKAEGGGEVLAREKFRNAERFKT